MTTERVVRKQLTVPRAPAEAFRLFTAGIGSWWPTERFSIHEDQVRELVFEEREGGELYEVSTSGEKAHWANVLAWEPPHRLVLEWKVNPESAAPTEIEVRFTPDGAGTQVVLEHRGWERLGAEGDTSYGNYDSGWELVLGRYVAGAGA